MTVLPSLPTLDVYVAFNPTSGGTLLSAPTVALPASGASNTYWTNISQYVQDFQSHSGKQHFIDRMQSGTLQMTVDNRTGYFLNGTTNGTGYVMQTRLPIAVTETWSATTHPIFFGLTETIEDKVSDVLNIDMSITASDYLKYLSLTYMTMPSFWRTYATSTSAIDWYRCTTVNTAVVTGATGNGTTITYQSLNTLSAGESVTITGLPTTTGKSLNLTHVAVASATSTSFTVTNSTVGTSVGANGTVYRTQVLDEIGSNNGDYEGVVGFPNHGAIIYDTDGCVDLSNGTGSRTGYIQFPAFTTRYGMDFWMLGQALQGQTLFIAQTGTATLIVAAVNSSGYFYATIGGTNVNTTVRVDDGYWHHIGLASDSTGALQLYADGQFFSTAGAGTLSGFSSGGGVFQLGDPTAQTVGMYVDEVVFSSNASLSTLDTEIQNRYIAGSMLQLPTNSTQSTVKSGDRIAQILCLAGFGSIVNGAISLNTNMYAINNGSAWVNGLSGNGYINVEPYYWDTPITGSTALDLILQICDTDIGVFFQKPNGTFSYLNQTYYGTWNNSTITAISSTSTTFTFTASNSLTVGQTVVVQGCTPNAYNGVWTVATASTTQFTVTNSANPGAGIVMGYASYNTLTYTAPTGDHVWTDDGSSIYAYDGPSLQVIRDDVDVWTVVKITPQAGLDQVYENDAAIARWGRTSLLKSSTVPPTLFAAKSAATYLGYLFRSPLPRIGNIEMRAETGNGAAMTALFAQIGDVVTLRRTSNGASTSGSYPDVRGQIIQDFVIESVSYDFRSDPGQLRASFVLDPYPVRT